MLMKAESDWAEVLGKIDLFAGLPDKVLRRIGRQVNEMRFPAGATILEEDTEGGVGRMYVVLEGSATVNIDGREVGTYGPGDHFGEMSLLDGGPRSATVTAVTDMSLAGLASWNLRPILIEEPSIALHLIEVLSKRLREAQRHSDLQ
jgi:CRP/FNR family transcriptional regulator, cyclic AMP receptor protein